MNDLLINTRGPISQSGEWIHIVPRGELPNKAAGVVQVLDQPALDSILANIEKDRAAQGENWPGLYAGKEHFIYNDEQSSEAFAWFKKFEQRADGIWANRDGLTDLGREAVEQKRFKFTSFVAHRKDTEDLGNKRVRILRVDTIGFTNNANGRHMLKPINNRMEDIISNGDFPGHPFRGNQYGESSGGGEHNAASSMAHSASKAASDKASHRKAAKAHMRAAKLHRDSGNEDVADYHESMAGFHDKRSNKLKNRDEFTDGTTPADETNNTQTMTKTSQLLGISADAGDDAFAAAVTKLQNRNTELETQNKEALGLVFDAKYANRFAADKAAAAKEQFIANRAAFETIVDSIAEAPKPERKDGNLLNRADAKTPQPAPDAADANAKRTAAVNDYRIKNRCTFEQAWNAVQAEKPELFSSAK